MVVGGSAEEEMVGGDGVEGAGDVIEFLGAGDGVAGV
jgi:hypothetical protein